MFGQVEAAAFPQEVGEAVRLDGQVALEEQERRQQVGAGRVAVAHSGEVGEGRGFDVRVGREGFADDAFQALDAECVVGEFSGHAMGQGVAEAFMAQYLCRG